MDLGTVSSEDVMTSYERQLLEACKRIAMLEAALAREQRASAAARALIRSDDDEEPTL